jgi:hypothetical protein
LSRTKLRLLSRREPQLFDARCIAGCCRSAFETSLCLSDQLQTQLKKAASADLRVFYTVEIRTRRPRIAYALHRPDRLEQIYKSGAGHFHFGVDFEPGGPLVILPAAFFVEPRGARNAATEVARLVNAASSSCTGSRSPLSAQAKMFLAISSRVEGVRILGGIDLTACSRTCPKSERSSGE